MKQRFLTAAVLDELLDLKSEAWHHGYRAALNRCHRVLANPASDEELQEWLRGYDAALTLPRAQASTPALAEA